jgi:hypothetical protein
MNEIEVWLDTDAPPDVAESLRAARAEAPRRAVVERCVTLVGAASAAALSASVAGAAAPGVGGKALGVGATVLVKSGVLGMTAGMVLMIGLELTDRALAPSLVSSPAPARAPSRRPMSHGLPFEPALRPPPSAEAPARRSVPPSRPSSTSADDRLTAELSLLSDVRAAIDGGDPSTALKLLVEHARQYPGDGRLQPEARYLELEALTLAGRSEDARGVARRILELDGRGPYAARARAILK